MIETADAQRAIILLPVAGPRFPELDEALPHLGAALANLHISLVHTREGPRSELGGRPVFDHDAWGNRPFRVGFVRSSDDDRPQGVATVHDCWSTSVWLAQGTCQLCMVCLADWLIWDRPDLSRQAIEALSRLISHTYFTQRAAPVVEIELAGLEAAIERAAHRQPREPSCPGTSKVGLVGRGEGADLPADRPMTRTW